MISPESAATPAGTSRASSPDGDKTCRPGGAEIWSTSDRTGVDFAVRSGAAERIWLCLFDRRRRDSPYRDEYEARAAFLARTLPGSAQAPATAFAPTVRISPNHGLWFDPDKLLMDPYAVAIDRPYAYDPRLALKRGAGGDTASLMPKAVVTALPEPVECRAAAVFAGWADLRGPGSCVHQMRIRMCRRSCGDDCRSRPSFA